MPQRLKHACHGLAEKGGQSLVADLVPIQNDSFELGKPGAQCRGHDRQTGVSELVLAEVDRSQLGHRPFSEGRGEDGGGLVCYLCLGDLEVQE